MRTASRSTYVRDSSKFRRGSDIRSGLPEGEESEMKNLIEKLKNDIKEIEEYIYGYRKEIEDILKEKDTIDVVENKDEVKSDIKIHSVTVIEQENNDEELRKYLK